LKVSSNPTNPVVSKTPFWLRLSALLLGIYLLSWLPFEDQDETRVLLSAVAVNAWIGIRYLVRFPFPSRKGLFSYTLVGFLAGLAVTPMALFLMAFKTGIHSHGSPDFTAEQILAIIYGTPIWAGAGLLVGFGGWLLHLAIVK
jgi:hypothetical protein